jgi:hypothetical protein
MSNESSQGTQTGVRWKRAAGVAALALAIAGCADQPPVRPHRHREPPPAPAPAPAPEAAPPQVYVYPTNGQSEAQLDRDRYECHVWAVKQTNFDPSEPHVAPHQRVQVVAMPPPGTSTVAGAATGAILGAAVSRPRDAGGGAVVGAVAGALIGAAADSQRQERAEQVQQRYDQRDAAAAARLEQQSNEYRRAIGACLEGRGYTVK